MFLLVTREFKVKIIGDSRLMSPRMWIPVKLYYHVRWVKLIETLNNFNWALSNLIDTKSSS